MAPRLRAPSWAWLVLPTAAVYAALWLVPLANVVRISFYQFSRLTGMREAWDPAFYEQVLTDDLYLYIWQTTFRVGAEAALATTLLGAAVAYGLWQTGGRLRGVLTALILTPLMISGVVRAYGWVVATGSNGLLPNLLSAVGLPPLTLIFNEAAVVVAFTHIFLPYSVLIIITSLDTIDRSLLQAAADLGASRWQQIQRIVMPLVRPALVSSLLLSFALAITSYAIPGVVGGNRVLMAALTIYEDQAVFLNWPRSSALAVVLAVLTVAIAATAQWIATRMRRGRHSNTPLPGH